MIQEIPRYRLTEPAFFEPEILPAGTELDWEGSPGMHMVPLNKAAHDKLEEWYMKRSPAIDKKGELIEGKTVQLRRKFRRVLPKDAPAAVAAANVRLPTDVEEKAATLAEVMGASKKSTDQRPGPKRVLVKPEYKPPVEAEAEAAPAPEELDPEPLQPKAVVTAAVEKDPVKTHLTKGGQPHG